MIVACFDDGSESIASQEFCNELIRDLPIITHVTVNETNNATGVDSIIWSKPTELDTINQFPGPYTYNIYRTNGFSGANILIHTTPSNPSLTKVDTLFTDNNLNTEDSAYTYRIELLSNGNAIGKSAEASSIYLSIEPTDEKLILRWNVNVSWINESYTIFKENSVGGFDSIGFSTNQTFIDSNLSNGTEYCYYVQSIGAYSIDGIINPIMNNSQINCAIPIDNVAPCRPKRISLEAQCEFFESTLTWNNPNNSCADDVIGYHIYFTPRFGDSLQIITTQLAATDTIFFRDNLNSIAGCYAVTAFDSLNNESALSDSICIDNCPLYELPNVFSPGGDGKNDFFQPFPYRYVQSRDLRIFERWREVVFTSQDPAILWDGKHQKSNKDCSDGVYYYTCTVHEIRLSGIESRVLTGVIHLLNEHNGNSSNSN